MIRFKRLSETGGMKVFLENGDYFGDVEDAVVTPRKIMAWKVRSTKNSMLSKIFSSGKGVSGKGVIVPHTLVKAVGDVFIISKSAVPSYAEDIEPPASAA